MRYNCPCTYHCVGPDLKSRENRCICANRSALSYSCLRILLWILFATRERVVREGSVGPNEHVVLKRHPSPQLNTALNCYSISDNHPTLNKTPSHMLQSAPICASLSTWAKAQMRVRSPTEDVSQIAFS